MEDSQIISLYLERDKAAILETEKKYGKSCLLIAENILPKAEAEECVNDAYLKMWNSIPPNRPDKFFAYLGRIVRNTAINIYNGSRRKKRYAGMMQILSEFEECIPAPESVENVIEEKALTEFLNKWLAALPYDDRVLFMRRYWNGEAVNALGREYGMSPEKMAKRMYKLRQLLKSELEREGYSL